MSKERKITLVFDIIFTIVMAVLVVVNVCAGDFGAAILWNMNFILWICNTTLDLARGEKEKIMMKLKEEDNEKK